MANFKTRISKLAKKKGRIILANDYNSPYLLESKTLKNIEKLHPYLCGIKLNFHLLLPLGFKEISKINKTAHHYGLQTIADIKLNDIGNTNHVTTENLWKMGFDAVIANPIMGLESLKNLVKNSHKKSKGVITLCHMSAPEAKLTYEMIVNTKGKKTHLYKLFLEWAISQKVDGIIAGATFPEIIQYCKKRSKGKLNIFSPGIGTQGGKIEAAITSGSNYLIVGRSILNSKHPVKTAAELQSHRF